MHTIEHVEQCADLHIEPRFFLDLAPQGVNQRFAKLDASAWQ
jgi:hypothetical protein